MNGVGTLAKVPAGRRTKWFALAFWILVLAVAGPLAGKLTGVQENDTVNWLPGNAESTQVYALAGEFTNPDEVPAVVVYERPSGITDADQAAVAADARTFATFGLVEGEVVGPIPSQDGQALELLVPVNLDANGWNKLPALVDKMEAKAAPRDPGLSMYVAGPAGVNADFAKAFEGIDGALLYSALAVVIVILLVTYRSPVLWLLPVISAGIALTVAQAVIYLLAEHAGMTVNGQTQGILTVLVFGAGTDYALLLVARYREELRRHEDRHEAMAFALHRAGPAIAASAATVVVGMLCLTVADMNSTASMGPGLAIGIAVGYLAMITLLPALLVTTGRWIFWPVRPSFGSADHTATGVWARVGRAIVPRPRAIWLTTTVVLGVLSFGVFQLNANGLSYEDSFVGTPDSIVGQRIVDKHFDSGTGEPVVVISRSDGAVAVQEAFQGTEGIAQETVSAAPPQNGYTYLEGTLTDPPDSEAAQATIERVRDAVHAVDGAEAKVGGNTAVLLDVERASARDNKVIIPVVLLVVFAILALLLRAIVAPLVLIATVVLSFFAAFGISAILFTQVLGFEGADAGLPLFAFVFLVALGIDYNIFLMTRVHEEAKQHGTRRGALIGLAATGAVITSAGLVLAGTFAVLATLPVVAFAEIGIVVALGVLLDTLVVRSVLVTALNLDIGRWMWWPSRLARTRDVEPDEALLAEPFMVEQRTSADRLVQATDE
ncbi:MAG: MMPL family transporter [Actinomycetes bacterium]